MILAVAAAVSLAIAFCAIVLFILVGIVDYQTRKIPNVLVIMGLGLYAMWALVTPGVPVPIDIIVGLALFAFGFVCWLLRFLGAGDAKFMLVCGLFSGLDHLEVFALALAAFGVAVYVLVLVSRRTEVALFLARWGLRGLEETGKIPYGVPLSLALVAAFVSRLGPQLTSIVGPAG